MILKRGFFTFGGWTLLSRLVGFVRDLLVAGALGAGPLADAFVVAQRLPNMFRSLFAEGALNAAFVPLFTQMRAGQGDDAARRFAAEANAVLFTILFFFVGLMMVFMPWVVRFIAPGFADEPYRFGVAVTLAQITFPYLLLISLTALQGGVLNAVGRLAPFAAAPVLYNVVQIAMILFVVPHAAEMGTDTGHILAWAVTLAGVGQWILLAYFCRRAGFVVRWQLPRLSADVRVFFRRLLPGVFGAGAAQINLVVSTMLASLLPTGAVSYLYYADRLNQLPLGVIGMAVSTALLPVLSQAVISGDKAHSEQTFARAVDLSMAFGLPAAVALALLGEPIYAALFVRGEFTAADAHMAAVALTGYAAGIPAFILVKICATRFFAAHDTKTPVRIAAVAVAANIALAVWLMPAWGAFGIALATSLATWVNFVLLRWRLGQQGAFTLDDLCRARLVKITAASTAMGAALWWLAGALPHTLAGLAGIVAAGVAVYGAGIIATRALSVSDIKLMLRKKNVHSS